MVASLVRCAVHACRGAIFLTADGSFQSGAFVGGSDEAGVTVKQQANATAGCETKGLDGGGHSRPSTQPPCCPGT